jgi:hypothetical protein
VRSWWNVEWQKVGSENAICKIERSKSKTIKRSVKMQIYKTLIRPVVTYGSENWTFTKSDENLLRIFERKILRNIHGPIQEGHIWRIRHNEELNRSINGEDIVKFIKARRIRWLGHVKRMDVGAMPRKMTGGRLFVGRRKGRPRLRWMDYVVADMEVMKIKQWMEKTKEREQWRMVVGRPRLTQGCSAERTEVSRHVQEQPFVVIRQ